ncbi:hypothetical protein [Thalassomonas haliotis]|uniref:Uncharacterized protein n=1 Tax=Thalassomonas haliotis TaxID=485448 RepID=A0ABY7VHF6_9GAMM|nr:hypothetical protein [Thalassomonas haliotis]WDE12654.1 hypothetical protein H3N35_04040 [Thalassomonas haliotis]
MPIKKLIFIFISITIIYLLFQQPEKSKRSTKEKALSSITAVNEINKSKEHQIPNTALGNERKTNKKYQSNKLNGKISEDKQSKQAPAFYLKEDSEEYQQILKKYKETPKMIVVDDFAYMPVKYEGGVDFIKLSFDEVARLRKEPNNVFNRRLEKLNTSEHFGAWSVNAEHRAEVLYSTYFSSGDYDIPVIQCRERLCLSEFTFSQLQAAQDFVDALRANRKNCRCRIWEYYRPDENMGVLEIEFFTSE